MRKQKNLIIDMWYGEKFEPKKYYADVVFYPYETGCCYKGNIYNNGKVIGDYEANNSQVIEENFIINWD